MSWIVGLERRRWGSGDCRSFAFRAAQTSIFDRRSCLLMMPCVVRLHPVAAKLLTSNTSPTWSRNRHQVGLSCRYRNMTSSSIWRPPRTSHRSAFPGAMHTTPRLAAGTVCPRAPAKDASESSDRVGERAAVVLVALLFSVVRAQDARVAPCRHCARREATLYQNRRADVNRTCSTGQRRSTSPP